MNEFDITEQVVEQLNKVLPTVVLPPDGVSPADVRSGDSWRRPAPAAAITMPAPLTPGACGPSKAGSGPSTGCTACPSVGSATREALRRVGSGGRAVLRPEPWLRPIRWLRWRQAIRGSSDARELSRWTRSPRRRASAGGGDALVYGVAPLQAAGPEQVSFIDNRRYAAAARAQTRGGSGNRAPRPRGPGAARRHGGDRDGRSLMLGWAQGGGALPPAPGRRRGRGCMLRRGGGARPAIGGRDGGGGPAGGDRRRGAVIGARGAGSGPGAVIGGRTCVIGADCRIGALASISACPAGGAGEHLCRGRGLGRRGMGFAQDRDGVPDGAAAGSGGAGGRRRGGGELHHRPRLRAGHGDRGRNPAR